jgi:hypothetical protein
MSTYNQLLRSGGDRDGNPFLNTHRDADGRRTAGGEGDSGGGVVPSSRVVVLAIEGERFLPGFLLLAELVRDTIRLRVGLVARKKSATDNKKEGSGELTTCDTCQVLGP